MTDIEIFIDEAWQLLGISFSLYGQTFSFRQVFFAGSVLGILCWALNWFFTD